MTFLKHGRDALAAAFPKTRWQLLDSGGEALEDDPFNAWMVVTDRELTLRLVRDHGLDHVDVQCLEEDGGSRWVSLEILSVAAGLKTPEQYAHAYAASLRAFEREDGEMPQSAVMIEEPLPFVAEAGARLVEAARAPRALIGAELEIRRCTRQTFERAQPAPRRPDSPGPRP